MWATVLQLVGLVLVVACATVLSLAAGGVAVGVALMYVGLAMERD